MGPYGKQLVYHLQGGEEDQGEGAGEAWGFGRFPCTSGRIGGALEVADSYTRPRGDGQEVSRRWTVTVDCYCGLLWWTATLDCYGGLLRSVTVDHGLMGVGRGFIWQEGNHRQQVKVEVVKGKVN